MSNLGYFYLRNSFLPLTQKRQDVGSNQGSRISKGILTRIAGLIRSRRFINEFAVFHELYSSALGALFKCTCLRPGKPGVMTPTPQEFPSTQQADVPPLRDGERVVISGMSGLYPDARHIQDLSNILYNKINPVSDKNSRWTYNHPEVARYIGKVPGLDRFDAQFCNVHYRLCENMDAMARKLFEQAYQAIYDAGVNPHHLSGRKVGVFIGACFSETESYRLYRASAKTGFGIIGCNKAMFANRISYWLNAKGPSLSIDEACCSSTAALEHAYLAMSRGDCEAAIVGGASLCFHPQSSVHYGRIIELCRDGNTKSFDQNADGCAKSEAINVLFLQKAKDALRIYADVLHVKSEFTSILHDETGGPRYGFYRDPMAMATFLKQFYQEARVPPQAVEYVEAFGSAVPEADKAELECLEEVFCKNRDDPLLVGSIMSNIGYSEAASGISGITKVLLGYQRGELAGNLHCERPRQDVSALREGRMQIVTQHRRFRRTYVAVNGISFTGVNSHVLLHGHYKPKDTSRYKSSLPQLVTISGRQESAVQKVLDDLKSRPVDPEEFALFHNIHQTRITGHLGRGYAIFDTTAEGNTICLGEKVNYFDDAPQPLWFVYSGMGSQWAGMGEQLMRIPIFASAIERCHRVLEPKGIDIVHLITSTDKTIFDNILHSFVGIAAVQIGLTDILLALGLVPDKIIGHSVGELGCAYADGCFTAEEMILSAYSRGLVSVQTPFIRGSMAAVGVGYEKIKKMCPPEIEVACHNGPESSTISGPADAMRKFVTELSSKGIFAKEVPCSNIAYHSRYIAEAGSGLLQLLSEVIKEPKPRSERWLSTSVPQDRWGEPIAKYSSAEYHTNNLLNPVLFEETSRLVPSNAVLVEVAPHGLLQAILKRSLPPTCKNIPLTRRAHADNGLMVLDAIGKLYMEGYYPKIDVLYPKVEFPVSTGTPQMSHLVEWIHNEIWYLPLYVSSDRKTAAASKHIVSLHDEECAYLQGHVIRGKILYPYAAALVATWDTLAMSLGVGKKKLSVHFYDVHFWSQPVMHDRRKITLSVALHRGTGRFEVLEETSKVITGYTVTKRLKSIKSYYDAQSSSEDMELDADDVYQMLFERDYCYKNKFRSIHSANKSLTQAHILWQNNWVTFIDGMLQLNMLRHNHDTVSLPQQLRNLYINVEQHSEQNIIQLDGSSVFKADVFEVEDYTRCGGVILQHITFDDLPRIEQDRIALKSLQFIPNFPSETINIVTALEIYLQVVAENVNKEEINVVGIIDSKDEIPTFNEIKNILDEVPGIKINYNQVHRENILEGRDHFLTDVDLVILENLSVDDDINQTLYRVLQRNTFVVNAEVDFKSLKRTRPSALYRVLSAFNVERARLELLRWRPVSMAGPTTSVTVRNHSDLALLASARAELTPRHKLLVITSYPPITELKEMIKVWRKDSERNQINLIMINQRIADNLDQLPETDLAFNVLEQGLLGGEYYVPWEEYKASAKDVTLDSAHIGDIDSLHWAQIVEDHEPGLTVTVEYAGLNDIDAKIATGVVPLKTNDGLIRTGYGMDYSGITESGVRVMGIVRGGAASSVVRAEPALTWPVPAHWSLEDAATVPLPYALAFYCLGIKSYLAPGKAILIHEGVGALGQAAISIALAYGNEVFTTVSDIRQKKFLLKLFPALKSDHIGNSCDITFADMVGSLTKGKGCDIVISCVKGELKDASLKSRGRNGVLLDVTQIQDQEIYALGMYSFFNAKSYCRVDFPSLFTNNDTTTMKKLQLMLGEGIRRGYVRPLSRVTYAPHEAPRAFRLLEARRHRGRVLLQLTHMPMHVQPRLSCSPDLCQLVLCDDNAFAFQLMERLVSRGVRKLHIHCSRLSTYLWLKIRSWEALGVKVEISSEDLLNMKNVVALLNASMRQGPVEGVYLITDTCDYQNIRKLNTALSNIDIASRKLCPAVKYFSVVSTSDIIGKQVCMSRERDRLPATMIKLPKLKKVDDIPSVDEQAISWRSAVDVTERGLCSLRSALLAHLKQNPHKSLLEQIVAIADVSVSDDTPDTTTLQELGVDATKTQAISMLLRNVHNLCFAEEDIAQLTIHKIRQIEVTVYENEYKEVKGLGTFISYVDSDELLATIEMKILPTLTNNSTMTDDEFDISQTFLCIVPGLEGHHERFSTVCGRLKMPAIVLQPGLDRLNETVQETAARYAKILLNRTQLQNNFYLLGYESGVLVALEMAAMLEEHGLTGKVFCLGFAPDHLLAVVEDELSGLDTEEALQDAVIRHMYGLMSKGNMEGLEHALEGVSTWKEKVEVSVRSLLGRVAHSAQYARSLIEAAYTRLQQVRRYSAQPRPLRSLLVLMQPASKLPLASFAELLQRYSHQPVAVHHLRAPLAHAAHDLRCSAILNQYLDADILSAYDQKNHCDTYPLAQDSFTTRSTYI